MFGGMFGVSKENKKKHFKHSRSLIEYVNQGGSKDLNNTLRSLIDEGRGKAEGGLEKMSKVIKRWGLK